MHASFTRVIEKHIQVPSKIFNLMGVGVGVGWGKPYWQ